MVAFNNSNGPISFNGCSFDNDCKEIHMLFELLADKVCVSIMNDVVREFNVDVNSHKLQCISDMSDADVLKSSSSLESDDLINYMENWESINIHNINID